MPTLPKHFITPEEYLALEREAQTKSEYYNGEMFAMSGASDKHCQLAFRLSSLLGNHLRGRRCRGYTSDMRVQVPGAYVYPDLSVVCGQPQLADEEFDVLVNPTLVVEILSPTTEKWDRGRKSKLYRSIASLQEYVLISQEEPRVEVFRRSSPWEFDDADGLDAAVALSSIGFTLRLRDLYEDILTEA
jgi:Uma2 family endonuclease